MSFHDRLDQYELAWFLQTIDFCEKRALPTCHCGDRKSIRRMGSLGVCKHTGDDRHERCSVLLETSGRGRCRGGKAHNSVCGQLSLDVGAELVVGKGVLLRRCSVRRPDPKPGSSYGIITWLIGRPISRVASPLLTTLPQALRSNPGSLKPSTLSSSFSPTPSPSLLAPCVSARKQKGKPTPAIA